MSKQSTGLALSKTGDINIVLGDNVKLSETEVEEITGLQQRLGALGNAQSIFGKQISELELKLKSNPEYNQLNRLRDKLKTARKMQKETQIVLDDRYEVAFAKRGITNQERTEIYDSALPDSKPKGKRGRPKLLGVGDE